MESENRLGSKVVAGKPPDKPGRPSHGRQYLLDSLETEVNAMELLTHRTSSKRRKGGGKDHCPRGSTTPVTDLHPGVRRNSKQYCKREWQDDCKVERKGDRSMFSAIDLPRIGRCRAEKWTSPPTLQSSCIEGCSNGLWRLSCDTENLTGRRVSTSAAQSHQKATRLLWCDCAALVDTLRACPS